MPLLALAVPRGRRPSITLISESLRMGVRHLQVSPASAHAVREAITASHVPRKELFLSSPWELPVNTEEKLTLMLDSLGTRYLDLVLLPRGPDARATWKLLLRIQKSGRIKALGLHGYPAEELDDLPQSGEAVEVAQCTFSPYRPGPTRATWRLLGQRSIALMSSGLFSDWPHALQPVRDPHVLAVAGRNRRSAAQVLLRWALQLGVAVTFHASSGEHVADNLSALGFELSEADMQLLSSLATLAEPHIAPGDGFAHVFDPRPQRPQVQRQALREEI